jgi:hypothetical protein
MHLQIFGQMCIVRVECVPEFQSPCPGTAAGIHHCQEIRLYNVRKPWFTIGNAGWQQYVRLKPWNANARSVFGRTGDRPLIHITRNTVSLSADSWWLAHCRPSAESAGPIWHGTLSTSGFPWVMEHKGYTG